MDFSRFHFQLHSFIFSAAYALGNISVGNLSFFLPLVLREIQSHVKRQYLLLHSLKEIINCQVSSFLQSLIEQKRSFSDRGKSKVEGKGSGGRIRLDLGSILQGYGSLTM